MVQLLTLPDKSDQWLTTLEAAEALGVHKSTLAKWRQLGAAPKSFMLGRERRWPASELNDWCRRVQALADAGGPVE